MAVFLQDLDQRFPIVDPETGKPTDYFMRLLRGQTGDLATGLTDADAAITALQTDVATLEGRNIDTGFGLSGGGDLSADRTIALGDPALTDPGADRILFWDDSAGQMQWLTAGSNLTITDTTIDASGGGGGGGSVYNASPVNKPLIASYTAVNAGTSSASDGTNALIYTPQTGNIVRGYKETTYPVGNFTRYLRGAHYIRSTSAGTTAIASSFGFFLRNSSNGRIYFLGVQSARISGDEQNTYLFYSETRSSFATAVANPILQYSSSSLDDYWLAIDVTGTQVTLRASPDGKDFYTVGTTLFSAYLTAAGGSVDEVGFCAIASLTGDVEYRFYNYGSTAP